jgi:hypothetical protein
MGDANQQVHFGVEELRRCGGRGVAVGNCLNGVSIPTIGPIRRTINFPVIGRVRFLTGLRFGSIKLLMGVAFRVERVRARIASIREALETIASGLRDLRRQLPDIQTNLRRTADDMESGGTDLIDAGNALQSAGTQLGGG